jgi:phospholipid-translocating ATPase
MKIVAHPPEKEIYDFKGYYQVDEHKPKEALSLKNTMWANTIMASQGYALGIVVYTGEETRFRMNSQAPGSKLGKTDIELNNLTKLLFIMMLLIALMIVATDSFKGYWYIQYFRHVLLINTMIPLALRTNLDMGKIYYSVLIKRDKKIEGTIPRNSAIPEELGRIHYLLSDKTGTLTKNDMTFKKLAMEYSQFDESNIEEFRQLLIQNCAAFSFPMADQTQSPTAFSINRS